MDFIAWMQEELEYRGWGQAELARRTNMSPAQISRIMTGENLAPSPEACLKIARVFKLPPEEVFRQAGLLPRRTVHKEDKELLFYFSHLSDKERRNIVAMVRAVFELKIDDN